jgi:hypothetical protein
LQIEDEITASFTEQAGFPFTWNRQGHLIPASGRDFYFKFFSTGFQVNTRSRLRGGGGNMNFFINIQLENTSVQLAKIKSAVAFPFLQLGIADDSLQEKTPGLCLDLDQSLFIQATKMRPQNLKRLIDFLKLRFGIRALWINIGV